ncbi:MAG: hypothetical protein KGI30_01450 [Planctomycetota bacterium]|nr:hypothetical protein [Planctomycetota bacterium]
MENARVHLCEVKRSEGGSATKHTRVSKRMVDHDTDFFITSKAMVNNLAQSWVRSLVTQHPHFTFKGELSYAI